MCALKPTPFIRVLRCFFSTHRPITSAPGAFPGECVGQGYHPGLKALILANEPDLKAAFRPAVRPADVSGRGLHERFPGFSPRPNFHIFQPLWSEVHPRSLTCRAMASVFDAILQAAARRNGARAVTSWRGRVRGGGAMSPIHGTCGSKQAFTCTHLNRPVWTFFCSRPALCGPASLSACVSDCLALLVRSLLLQGVVFVDLPPLRLRHPCGDPSTDPLTVHTAFGLSGPEEKDVGVTGNPIALTITWSFAMFPDAEAGGSARGRPKEDTARKTTAGACQLTK